MDQRELPPILIRAVSNDHIRILEDAASGISQDHTEYAQAVLAIYRECHDMALALQKISDYVNSAAKRS